MAIGSESARMSSATEARFRVPSPATAGRAVNVVALDPASDAVVARLAGRTWNGVRFFPASALPPHPDDPAAASAGITDAAEIRLNDLVTADLVIMLAASGGGDAQDASALGRICNLRRVMTTAIVVHSAPAMDEALSKTLAQVRPWSSMVVVASDDSYVEDVLRSFR
jgi:hypothetical protein